MFLYVFISTTACLYAVYLLFFYFSCILPVGPCANPASAELLLSQLQFLRALWRPNPCLSFYFSICLCSTMSAPVPNGTLWLQTSPFPGLPLVERRPHYLVPGVWSGRGVSATRFPDTPPPSKRKLGRKDEKNGGKTSAAIRILVPRGPQGRSLLMIRQILFLIPAC